MRRIIDEQLEFGFMIDDTLDRCYINNTMERKIFDDEMREAEIYINKIIEGSKLTGEDYKIIVSAA